MSRAKTAEKFDYEAFEQEAVKRLMAGERLGGKDGIMAPLLQRFIQLGLEGEMDAHLDQERSEGSENRRNGRGRKRIRSEAGVLEIEPPRDRDGSFSPQLVEKRQRQLNTGLDSQILYLYARGSSYSEISEQLEQIYGVEVSPAVISRVTDRVMPLLQEWRTRPLEAVYPFVFLDAIHYKVRDDGRVVNKAVHVVIGVTREGHKDVLGMYLGQAGGESAKFWMQVLSDLKSRGTEDILIACIDNLSGFAEAIGTVYPQTEVQLCIVHQIRNSRKYLSWKDTKAFMADLRRVYGARSRDEAEGQLDKLDQLWGERYPAVIRSWRSNWDLLSAYFRYPPLIRKTIYTTNLIESFNRQLRRVTKTKGAFTSDDALMKLLYLIQDRVSAEWQKPLHNWNQTLRDLSAFFGKRLPLDL
jgi:transposase-like protein